jgi:hypothetical protein
MIVVSQFINVLDALNYIAFDKLLIFLTNSQHRSLNFAYKTMQSFFIFLHLNFIGFILLPKTVDLIL